MPKHRRAPTNYTPGEKEAIVAEIQRRQLLEKRSTEYLARSLGISDKSYYNWLHAGVRAANTAAASTPHRP